MFTKILGWSDNWCSHWQPLAFNILPLNQYCTVWYREGSIHDVFIEVNHNILGCLYLSLTGKPLNDLLGILAPDKYFGCKKCTYSTFPTPKAKPMKHPSGSKSTERAPCNVYPPYPPWPTQLHHETPFNTFMGTTSSDFMSVDHIVPLSIDKNSNNTWCFVWKMTSWSKNLTFLEIFYSFVRIYFKTKLRQAEMRRRTVIIMTAIELHAMTQLWTFS